MAPTNHPHRMGRETEGGPYVERKLLDKYYVHW